jgi:hypothetical protein
MDLALSLGKTLAELDDMPQRELVLWGLYEHRYFLPWKRVELQLALLTQHVAAGRGVSLKFDEARVNTPAAPQVNEAGTGAGIIASIGGVGVRRLGKKRQKG